MIVPDTSAWIEFLRSTDHTSTHAIKALLEEQADVLLTECVLMEVLAGAKSEKDAIELRETFSSFPTLRLNGPPDFKEAAQIYRTCRSWGHTLKSQIDCLIAVPVIRAGAELLHNDSDFDAIARHSELRIYSP
ncbi:MAG: PIN domain nuclease [Actinomycetota bacterium]